MLVGIDSLEIARIKSIVQDDIKSAKIFSEYEIEYGNKTVNSLARFAGMFCAKEAFLKCLKIGIGGGIALSEIEVKHIESGAPFLSLSKKAQQVVDSMGITKIDISITHTETTSTAICICV